VLNHDAILLENHGVVTCGEDLTTAYQRMETVEQFARVMSTAELLGGPHVLPCAEVQKLVTATPRPAVSCQRDKVETPMRSGFAGDRVTPARLDPTPLKEETIPGDQQ
jgi:rhamnose utilization protein RhaD (predicted bifunctional aldolase and dehydrogenase)